MNDQYAKLLTDLGNKLGTTGEHLWEVLVRQAPINSLIFFAFNIGLVIAAVWLSKVAITWGKKHRDDYSDFPPFLAPAIGAVILWFIIIFSVGTDISTAVAGFVNPEYAALHEVMEAFKK